MTKNPEDRRDAARAYIESVGGKLHGFWYAFGEYDGYNLCEAPDNVSMAAVALANGGGGDVVDRFEIHAVTRTSVRLGQGDLLVPIAAHYRPLYEQAQANERAMLRQTVNGMLGSPKRRRAWNLADGTRTQRQSSQQAPLDEGSTSKLFKALREIGAVVDTPNPTRTVEID